MGKNNFKNLEQIQKYYTQRMKSLDGAFTFMGIWGIGIIAFGLITIILSIIANNPQIAFLGLIYFTTGSVLCFILSNIAEAPIKYERWFR